MGKSNDLVQNTGMRRKRPLSTNGAKGDTGMFDNGRNCGRWIEITLNENCVDGNSAALQKRPVVCGVDASLGNPRVNFAPDSTTGTRIYAIVADSCHDDTYWCGHELACCFACWGSQGMFV